MQLQDALWQINEIRARIDRTETFRGYRALTIGFSGLLGLGAATLQSAAIPRPLEHLIDYLTLWVGVAVVSLLIVGAELAYRSYFAVSPLSRRLTILAVQQFLPSLVAGASFTWVFAAFAPEAAWVLPGLWAIVFSLGVFASCRLLPRPTFWVGVYYLISGSICLAVGNGSFGLSPWMMVGTFGVGQCLAASILYWSLERNHEPA